MGAVEMGGGWGAASPEADGLLGKEADKSSGRCLTGSKLKALYECMCNLV